MQTLSGYASALTSVAFSPDGKTLVGCSNDLAVKFWGIETREELPSLCRGDCKGTTAAFSPDGKRLALGGAANLIKVWDLGAGGNIMTLSGHASVVSALAFSPDGKTILSGSWDGSVKLWDAREGGALRELKSNSFRTTSVAFSPDGRRFASGSALGSVVESPSLYILTLGVNKYAEPNNQRYAVADAQEFADAVERVGQGVFERINKQVLVDEQVTREGVQAAFDRIASEARPQDVFVFHFAGIDGGTGSEFYILPGLTRRLWRPRPFPPQASELI